MKDFIPAFGLGFSIAIMATVSYEISVPILGIDTSYIIVAIVEELCKMGLFVFFRARAFYSILLFAAIEVVLVKLPLWTFTDLYDVLHGVVFTALAFFFHVSTAFLYDHLFSNRPNLILFYVTLLGMIVIHVAYNTMDASIPNLPLVALFCFACSLTVLGVTALYKKPRKAVSD